MSGKISCISIIEKKKKRKKRKKVPYYLGCYTELVSKQEKMIRKQNSPEYPHIYLDHLLIINNTSRETKWHRTHQICAFHI